MAANEREEGVSRMSMPEASISGVFLAFCFHESNWKT